ncbi:hypothetical protein H4R20_002622 [Coemansia guatemalensis]|uniref:TPR-like protein n=1 Tax=Coemansia guatemalensis TaxID=2761395 RepID=A0A9W8HWV9_9FUNG|nr:hypothetical protein H4R20_002622 [Coemansia guatemalensis]
MDQLLAKTQELMDDNNYDDALKVVVQAINLDERNHKALLLAAVIQLESGDVEPAINCLLRCAEISPERGFEKYMYLGQFTVELESVRYYQLGVDALQRDLEEVPKNSEHAAALRRKMAEAYVAMTEIFLTDCCFESNAEEKCEEYLKLGAAADPTCPEVYQTMASVRLSQDRPDDARECLAKSMALWSDKDQNDPTQIPSYDNRLGLVRLLLELDNKDQALGILERLQKEDDESVDLWYLYGWTYHLQSEESGQSDDEKTEALISARECFGRAIKLADAQDFENDALIKHARELVAGISATVPLSADDEEEEERDNANPNADAQEEGWEDVSSDAGDSDIEMKT